MKRRIFILSLLAACLAMLAAGTLAYYTSEGTAHNVITTGGIGIELHEWANEAKTEPFEDLTGVMPGVSATKIAEVENTGASEAWIRVLVEKKVTLSDGSSVETDLISLDINDKAWTRGIDGYYYYNKALAPGETTEPIFTAVTFAPEMGNEYQNSTATVDVTAQAVQTANNGDSATAATGWPKA